MKVNFFKGQDSLTKNDVVLGWNLVAENKEEEQQLSLMRGLIFFGLDDTYPKYAGRTDNPESGLVQKIWYRIPAEADKLNTGRVVIDDEQAKKQLENWNPVPQTQEVNEK